MEAFCAAVVEATLPYAVAYKPNLAFFEQYGAEGWAALERVVANISSDVLVIADDQGHVSGVELRTGEVRWRRDLGEAPLGPASRNVDGVLLTTPGRLVAVRARDGAVQRFGEGDGPTWSGTAVRQGDRLVCARRDGVVQVLDARSGQPLYLLPGDSRSRILQTSERLFVTDEDHEVRCHRALR